MPEKVVCNASPLIFLAKVQRLDLLIDYNLFIPSQVESEIVRGMKHKRENATLIIEYFKKKRIKPMRVPLLTNLPHFLGLGERAVISLAVREKIERVFIDEAKARTVARFYGLKPKGTMGILWATYSSGVIDRENVEMLTLDLVQKGYRIKEEILIEFLRKIKT